MAEEIAAMETEVDEISTVTSPLVPSDKEDSVSPTAQLEPEEPEEVAPTPEEPPTPPSPPKPKVNIVLKTPKEKQFIEVDEDAEIKDIKAIAAEKFSADPEYLCLIFAGKLMEDSDTLVTHSIKDGMTINLIIKSAPRQPEPGPQRPPADVRQTPYGLGAIGGLVGLESLGLGSSNFMELQNRLQTELVSNPELLRRVLENPLVQTLMSDSENMKNLISNNTQMQDLMSRHPEINVMLNNPELLKQTAELAKNPSMLQELMRNVDGTNPMENETSSFATLPSFYANFQGTNLTSLAEKVQQSQTRTDTASVFNNPQMSSLLQQMSENPQLVQNMMSAPYTQSVLQALSADPAMASAIVTENPLYQGNPALQNYMTSMMPQLINQLQNPEIHNMMANPQAVNALLQIQEGMEQLRNVAPGLVSNIGMGSFNDYTGNEQPATPTTPAENTPPEGDSFSQFMARMVSQMGQSNVNLPPDERFKVQLDYIKAMGFTNEDNILRALTATFGDINAAVEKLISKGGNTA